MPSAGPKKYQLIFDDASHMDFSDNESASINLAVYCKQDSDCAFLFKISIQGRRF